MQTQRPFLFNTAPPQTAAACGHAELSSRAPMAALGSGRHGRGFTVLEVMIVVAIAGVLAAIAAPGMMEFVRANRLSTTARQLDADLLLARREAIKRNAPVLVCPVISATDTSGNCGSDWRKGWLVCYEILPRPTTLPTKCADPVDGDPNPIRRRGAIEPTLTLTGSAAIVRFNANGTQGAGGAGNLIFTTQGTWTPSKSYVGAVSATGNVSMKVGS